MLGFACITLYHRGFAHLQGDFTLTHEEMHYSKGKCPLISEIQLTHVEMLYSARKCSLISNIAYSGALCPYSRAKGSCSFVYIFISSAEACFLLAVR